jgi:CubicO group peptidase (beta-lactamase class C family)
MRILFLSFITAFSFIVFTSVISGQQKNNESGQITLPDNAIAKIVKEFNLALNSQDSDSIQFFVDKYLAKDLSSVGGKEWSSKKYISLLNNLMRDGGLITLVDIRQNSDQNYLAVIFKTSKTEKPVGIEFIKDKGNNTLRSMEVHVLGSQNKPYQWPGESLDEQGIANTINEKIKKDFEAGLFSGNVLVVKGDKVLLQKSFGYADKQKQILNNNNTRFHTGSLGKMITATAIAQLVEKGKLRFTDTLRTILKDYPNKEAANNITVHELLTHTSGIADPFELGRRKPGVDYSTAKSVFPLFADAPLSMVPGSHHSYSNGNYAVLAVIVEKVSGMSFENYLQQNIFIPAGMEVCSPDSYKKLELANRYSHDIVTDPLSLKPETQVSDPSNDIQLEYSGFCNGYLTAEDVYKFLYSLKEGKLVSAKMVEEITSGKVSVDGGSPVKYAYGFYDANMWGVNFRGHSGGGGNSGIGAEAEILWSKDYYVIVLGNCDLDKVRPITFSVVRFLGNQQ